MSIVSKRNGWVGQKNYNMDGGSAPTAADSGLTEVGVTIVHKIKSKLGYTETDVPFDPVQYGFEDDKVKRIDF